MYYAIKAYPLQVQLEQIARNEYKQYYNSINDKEEICKMKKEYEKEVNNMELFDVIGFVGLLTLAGCGSAYVEKELEKTQDYSEKEG